MYFYLLCIHFIKHSRSEKITSRSTFSLLELIFSLLEVYFSLLEVHFSTFQRPKKWGGGSIFIGRVESIHSNKEFEFPKKKIRSETTPSSLYLINWIGIWNLELGTNSNWNFKLLLILDDSVIILYYSTSSFQIPKWKLLNICLPACVCSESGGRR